MKTSIKSLILMTFVAFCLMLMPAFSAPSDSQNFTSCTEGKSSACTGCTGSLGKMNFEEYAWFPGHYPNSAFINKPALSVMPVYLGKGFAISPNQVSQYNLLANEYRRFEHIRPCRV